MEMRMNEPDVEPKVMKVLRMIYENDMLKDSAYDAGDAHQSIAEMLREVLGIDQAED
jgi:hypothetical protein